MNGRASLYNQLERLRLQYTTAAMLHASPPDPLAVLKSRRDSPADGEVAGLIVALLAFGSVEGIVRAAAEALTALGDQPALAVRHESRSGWRRRFRHWRYRWVDGENLADLLVGVRRVLEDEGSLNAALLNRLRELPMLSAVRDWTRLLRSRGGRGALRLIPDPDAGSANKRIWLYLRWMVRKDPVDLGYWKGVSPATLVVPLDVHLHRAAIRWGLTTRRSADLETALEITRAFRALEPSDPLRWDFAISRAGILGARTS